MINKEMTDKAIAEALGLRLKQLRLSKGDGGITQSELANHAGINRSTVVALEQGRGKLETLIPVLRVLDALELLDNLAPPTIDSPLALAKRQGAKRVRASRKTADSDTSSNSHSELKGTGADW